MSTKAKPNQQVGIFVLNNSLEYPWTCYPFVPNPSGGKKIKQKLKVRFCHISKAERMELLDEFKQKQREALKAGENPQDEEGADALRAVISFQRLLLERVLTWFECLDKDGNPVEPTDEGKTLLLDNEWASDAIWYGLQQSWVGRNDEGN